MADTTSEFDNAHIPTHEDEWGLGPNDSKGFMLHCSDGIFVNVQSEGVAKGICAMHNMAMRRARKYAGELERGVIAHCNTEYEAKIEVLEKKLKLLRESIQRQGATLFYVTAGDVLEIGLEYRTKKEREGQQNTRTLYACQSCGEEFGDGEAIGVGRCPHCHKGIGDPIGTIEDDAL